MCAAIPARSAPTLEPVEGTGDLGDTRARTAPAGSRTRAPVSARCAIAASCPPRPATAIPSRSSRSSCAPPESRTPARWSRFAPGRIPTAISAAGSSPSSRPRSPARTRTSSPATTSWCPRQERNLEAALGRAGDRPHRGDPRHLRRPRPQRRGKAPGGAGPARVQPRADARACGPTSSGSAAGSAPGAPARSQIETDRRLARDRIANLRRRLERLERNREVMRARRSGSALPIVALAGYTNAGKSTLLNALTGAGVGVGERLFHTLDPTTRAYRHNGRRYLLTDTVGFIRKLPHQLVEAFKATLEETVARRPHRPRRRRLRAGGAAPRGDRRRRLGARGDRRRRGAPTARLQQGGPAGRRPRRTSSRSATRDRWRSPRSPGEGLEELRDRIESTLRGDALVGGAAVSVLGGRRAGRAPRGRRRPRARGSRRTASWSTRASLPRSRTGSRTLR